MNAECSKQATLCKWLLLNQDFMPLSLIGLNLNLIWLNAVEINRKLIQIEPDQINQLIETSGIEVTSQPFQLINQFVGNSENSNW